MNQSLPYQATALGLSGYRSLSVSFPRSALSQQDSRIGAFHKLRIDDGSPRGAMLTSYMDHLFKGMGGWSDTEVTELGEQQSVDRAVPGAAGAGARFGIPIAALRSRRQRVLAYRSAAPWRTAPSPQQVAQGCGIVSYLHRILRAGGLSVESFVISAWTGAASCSRHRHRWHRRTGVPGGLHPPSHFSRLFKNRFDMTPRDLRALKTVKARSKDRRCCC